MSIATTFLGPLERGPRHGYDLERSHGRRFGRDVEPGEGPDRKRYAIEPERLDERAEQVAA